MILLPGQFKIEGFLRIFDPNSGETFVDKKNAIHYENISIAMAETLHIGIKAGSISWPLATVVVLWIPLV